MTNRNLDSTSKLTEFAPLSPENKPSGVVNLLSKLFKSKKNEPPDLGIANENSLSSSQEGCGIASKAESSIASDSSSGKDLQFHVDIAEERSLPNVLKRISNLLALKSVGLQAYGETDLKQYWMPDSVSRECYDCGERFTTFRRRHHCRICGQIFCSRCCSQEVPGKIVGCTGDLRVCTYCCKVVLTYLQSADENVDLSADLRALQEDLQIKFGSASSLSTVNSVSIPSGTALGGGAYGNDEGNGVISSSAPHGSFIAPPAIRKHSLGYQEERFALVRDQAVTDPVPEEDCNWALLALRDELRRPGRGLSLHTIRNRLLKVHHDAFSGCQLVDWLIDHGKAADRMQACAVGEALLDGGLVECVSDSGFQDNYAVYRFIDSTVNDSLERQNIGYSTDVSSAGQEGQEPSWVKDVPQNDSTATTDSESECMISETEVGDNRSIPSSSSMYCLDLDLHQHTVHLARPPTDAAPATETSNEVQPPPQAVDSNISNEFVNYTAMLHTAQGIQTDKPGSWHQASHLRSDNGEQQAYTTLNEEFGQHEIVLLNQLLSAEGLSQSWAEVALPLVHEIMSIMRLDSTRDADGMDIRQYVQFKKVPGGSRSECEIINGVVCTKNVAHRAMKSYLENPRILLLNSAIVYQRREGRYLSLEPVMMQEQEFLRNVVARIEALQPDLMLVSRNVSRLAQESLRILGVTLALNVKLSVLERVAKCTQGQIVTSVDTRICRPQLGSCKAFYVRTFSTDRGPNKTLMFFEGSPSLQSQFACSVLLRGGSYSELSRLKRVLKYMVYTRHHWRKELSFLMDEFAWPPDATCDSFFDDGSFEDSSTKKPSVLKSSSEEQGSAIKSISSQSSLPLCTSTPLPAVNDGATFNFVQDDVFKKDHKSEICIASKNRRFTSTSDPPELLRRSTAESVSDFSDPLHQYLNSGDEGRSNHQSTIQQLAVAKIPFLNQFRKALDDTILSSSPYLKFTVPFLETEPGRNCDLRQYFPQEIYWSSQFTEKDVTRSRGGTANTLDNMPGLDSDYGGLKLESAHPFIKARLTSSAKSQEIRELLAHFRACGGRINPNHQRQNGHTALTSAFPAGHANDAKDVLDPNNHQHLYVLFCSFSPASEHAHAFCVSPWVVKMEFYGRLDVPLGFFLERYCFRSTYDCPHKHCNISMYHHIRRFVHYPGCVELTVRLLEGSGPQTISNHHILMWSRCNICNTTSPVFPMSPDTWSLSFAKYLELRFHAGMYRLRGDAGKESLCSHSLHSDFQQYFGFANIVASFKYSKIMVWEVSLPPPLVILKWEKKFLKLVNDEIGQVAVTGQQVFSNVLEKLFEFGTEEPGIASFNTQLQKDKDLFKCKVHDALAETQPVSETEQWELLWPLEDALSELIRSVMETVNSWNARLQSLDQKPRAIKTSFSFLPEATEGMSCTENSTDTLASAEDAASPLPVDSSSVTSSATRKTDSSDLCERNEVIEEQDDLAEKQVPPSPQTQRLTVPNEQQSSLNQSQGSAGRQSKNSASDAEVEIHSDSGDYLVLNSNEFPAQQPYQSKSVKTILSQLLPSTPAITSVCMPQLFQEIHLMPRSASTIPVAVRESQPSSIIAYALASNEYHRSLEEILQNAQAETSTLPIPQPAQKKVQTSVEREKDKDKDSDVLKEELIQSADSRRAGVLSFLRGSSNTSCRDVGNIESVAYSTGTSNPSTTAEASSANNITVPSPPIQNSSKYIEVQFSDSTTNFFCRIYYAEEFHEFRKLVWPSGEEGLIRSLSRCVPWAARGGKSGSTFCKTRDNRIVLKEMSRIELTLFLERAPCYFHYMTQSHKKRRPTLLGKILGVFRIVFKNDSTGNSIRVNLLAMENLFYGRDVSHKFDLKGSVRNRMVNPGSEPREELVLLDENLIKITRDNPLYILPHTKTVLSQAIRSDTEFLAAQSVMDYSLLVGLDETQKELVVGIIDYIRTFTWDKKLETYFKKMSGQGKAPTIVQPEEYQKRFIDAMNSYFLIAPDRWSGFGNGFDC